MQIERVTWEAIMWAWINVAVMVVLAVVTTAVYVRSVSPAALEKKIGPEAYAVCGRTRKVAMGLYLLFFVPYVRAAFYPPAPFPRGFPWPYWMSAVLGALIAVPSTALMLVGVWHAGEETLLPRKEHTMYGGIYKVIRHPQSLGEVIAMWGMALLLNSPFLAVFNVFFLLPYAWMLAAEEKDLLIRYGETYRAYQQRTGAVFPKLGRWMGRDER